MCTHPLIGLIWFVCVFSVCVGVWWPINSYLVIII